MKSKFNEAEFLFDTLDNTPNTTHPLEGNFTEELGPHIARDPENFACYLIPISDPSNFTKERTKCIAIDCEPWDYLGNGEEYVDSVVIKCLDRSYEKEFFSFLDRITTDIEQSAASNYKSAKKILKRFRELMSNFHERSMTHEQLIGLFSELSWMSYIADVSPSQALNFWEGDSGSSQDFKFPSSSVEVKAIGKDASLIVSISSLHQLDEEPDKSLYLYVSRILSDSTEESSTINDLIKELDVKGVPEDVLLERLANSTTYPYYESDEEKYNDQTFLLKDQYLYHVNDNFPRLRREDINESKSKHIVEIDYKIELAGLEELIIPKENYQTVINELVKGS